MYAKLFSVPEYSLELPVSYRKYTTLKLNGKQLGSHRSISSSSLVVIASWNYQLFGPSTCTSSVESSEDGEDRRVRINYFAVHTFTLCETARDVKIILFSASWFKFNPNKDNCGKPVTIWECDIFESQPGVHIIPVQLIKCRTVSLVDTFNHAFVLFVSPCIGLVFTLCSTWTILIHVCIH